jgi:hypothetical protein
LNYAPKNVERGTKNYGMPSIAFTFKTFYNNGIQYELIFFYLHNVKEVFVDLIESTEVSFDAFQFGRTLPHLLIEIRFKIFG